MFQTASPPNFEFRIWCIGIYLEFGISKVDIIFEIFVTGRKIKNSYVAIFKRGEE